MAFTFVTVTHAFETASDAAAAGVVTFLLVTPIHNGTTTIAATLVTATLSAGGLMSQKLAANTDPATTPTGTTYQVTERIVGQPVVTYYVQVPHDQGATVNLVDLSGWVGGGGTARVAEGPLSLLDPRVDCILDGSGDQAANVAVAIGLLPATGGHIYQPPGILRTGAISFDKPVRWEGAGEGQATIKAASGFTGTLVTITGNAPFSRVSDVTLDGGGSATKLVLVSSARTRLDHLHLTAQAGSSGAAIHFNGTDANTASAHAGQMSDVRIVSCTGYGVYLQGFAYDNEWSNLWIGSCNVGMRIENTDCFFSNLHVWGSTGNGVEVRGANNRFTNVYVETNGGDGLNLFNAHRTKITNGSVWKNQGQGVSVATSDRVLISGLNIYDQGGNGVNASNSLHGKVIGCDFYDDTSSAQTQDRPVITSGTSDKWIICENTMLTSEHATGANSLVGSNNVVANNVTA